MFNCDVEFSLSPASIESFEKATNAEDYNCPLLKSDISEINSRILTDQNFKDILYSLEFGIVSYNIWKDFATCFRCTNSLSWKPEINGYQFIVCQKMLGSEKIKTPLSDSFFRKIIGHVYCYITIQSNGGHIKLSTNFMKAVVLQRPVKLEISEYNTSSNVGKFIFEENTFKLSSEFYDYICENLKITLIRLKKIITNFIFKNGNIFNLLHHLSYKYPKACNCSTIEAVWNLAIKVFPAFRKAPYNVQATILQNAYNNAFTDEKCYEISPSVFASKLYYQIMKNRLDYNIIIGHSEKTLVCQRWSREYKGSPKPVLLKTQYDFEHFDYKNISPTELIWVNYSGKIYLVGQMFELLTPSNSEIYLKKY